MNNTTDRNFPIETCPIRNVVARFGNKWSLLVLLVIDREKTIRFNELNRLISDISTRILSGTLTHGNRQVANSDNNATDCMGTREHATRDETPQRLRK